VGVKNMREILRLNRENVIFVAVDFQEKLMPAMNGREKLEKNVIKLAKGLDILEVPRLVTTQYAKGLGNTVEAIADAIGAFQPIDKDTFSAYGSEVFCQALKDSRKNIVILAGIETHICVEQTALDLIEAGYKVVLAADCVSSRDEENMRISLNRLGSVGVVISSSESLLYELVGGAKADKFKEISAVVK
jgi:hypothetical protein